MGCFSTPTREVDVTLGVRVKQRKEELQILCMRYGNTYGFEPKDIKTHMATLSKCERERVKLAVQNLQWSKTLLSAHDKALATLKCTK